MQNSFGVNLNVNKGDVKHLGWFMVVLEKFSGSDAKAQKLHVPTFPVLTSIHDRLYTCKNNWIRNRIPQDLIDTIESKYNKELNDVVLKLSFEQAIDCFFQQDLSLFSRRQWEPEKNY